MSLQPILIAGNLTGLTTNVKPWLVPDQAFSELYNAYIFRDRIVKREPLRLLGRLQRVLTSQALGMTSAGTTFTLTNIFTTIGISGENPEMNPGTLVITVGSPDTATFTDNGNGTFTVTGAGVASGSYINYITGQLVLKFTSLTGGATVTANLNYYPSLPVMDISQRETNYPDVEDCICYDTKYAYRWDNTNNQFVEYIPGTTWAGTNYNGYWTTNFSAGSVTSTSRYYFVTNFVPTSSNPMRYTSDGSSWHTFDPAIDSSNFLYQALILLPYYGRLIALNTREGSSGLPGTNFYNRCRYAAIGDPTGSTAWRTDIPGQGGFLDAPTNEAIMSASFYKNTLIVEFENSTWQLRYLGEYGQPFQWERTSSDFGSISTFSAIVFDQGALFIGDKALIQSTDLHTNRIDTDIPDEIFFFENENNGPQRVQGVRDFQRELALWSYVDSRAITEEVNTTFPNRVLVYNYRNQTWAIFRDNVTAFGTFQTTAGNQAVTWDSTDITWDSDNITWDDVNDQYNFPYVLSGNQEGFVHYYGYDVAMDDPSLSITAVTANGSAIQLTINNHNLEFDDVIYVSGLQFINSTTFLPVTTNLNNQFYQVSQIIDENNIIIASWNFAAQQYYTNLFGATPYTPILASSIYVGGGSAALIPVMVIITKDFNPYQAEGKQMKISSVDIQVDTTDNAEVTINLYANAQTAITGNMLLGNNEVETYVNPYAPPFPSFYAWHRFYANMVGQFLRIEITYDYNLMNTLATHTSKFELNGIKLNVRPGGHLVF